MGMHVRHFARLRLRGLTPVTRPACAAAEATSSSPMAYHPSPLSQAAPATYAVIEVGGVQMFVEPGKWYSCNRLKVRRPPPTTTWHPIRRPPQPAGFVVPPCQATCGSCVCA